MLTVLTLLLVLTSGQRFMPTSQAPQAKRSAHNFDSSLPNSLTAARRYWLRATAVSGAAASLVSTTAGEGIAIASQSQRETVLPESAQPEGYTIARAADAIDRGAAALPNLAQTAIEADSATFSGTQSAASSTAQTSLIQQAQDGSWTLSVEEPADENGVSQRLRATRTQSVLSDLAAQTARTRQACAKQHCGGLAYIESRLPEARQTVRTLQAQLDDFESHRAQQDMEGYQELLTDRIFEIAQQKQDLLAATAQNQQRITRLKMRLVQQDADLELAERALNADATYQADWNRLLQAEQNLANEFSQINIDATDLNEIYDDYQYHQQQAALSAGESLGNYLLQLVTVPSFIERSPDALTDLQDLTVTTHQYRAQKLRQTSIGQIEKRLNDRERQLLGDVGEYEIIQRELASAQQIVAEYETERDRILASQLAGQEAQQTAARSHSAMNRALRLAPLLPKGSVSQGVVFAVLAAGAIATIAARRRERKATVPALSLPNYQGRDYSFQPTALQQANLMAAIKLPPIRLSAAQLQTDGAALQDIPVLPLSKLHPTRDDDLLIAHTAFKTGGRPAELKLPNLNAPSFDAPNLDSPELEQLGSALNEAALPVSDLSVSDLLVSNLSLSNLSLSAAKPPETALEKTDSEAKLLAPTARLHGEEAPTLDEILAGEASARDAANIADFEQRILTELMEITGQTVHMLNPAPEETAEIDPAANRLTIEMMVKELSEVVGGAPPASSLAKEIQRSDIAPTQISLDDVDLFAEHAVHWILKDLGISSQGEIDKAEAAAWGWSDADVAEVEAISIESLEIVQMPQQPVYSEQAGLKEAGSKESLSEDAHQVVGEVRREFATVAA